MKTVSAALISAQVLLSNFCFIDIGFANSVPTPTEPEMETIQEMVMTPVDAKSPLHCDEGCITIMRPLHHVDMEGMRVPCGDGHCLMEHTPTVAAVTQSPLKDSVVVPSAIISYEVPPNTISYDGWNERHPVQITLTNTIVLRE